MRILRSLVLLGLLAIPAAFAHARVVVGIGIGPVVVPPPAVVYGGYGDPYDYGYGPPACSYGYYGYYPYACAPYGYYGSDWR